MKQRYDRLETLRIILSRGEAGSQESILRQLTHMGFDVTRQPSRATCESSRL